VSAGVDRDDLDDPAHRASLHDRARGLLKSDGDVALAARWLEALAARPDADAKVWADLGVARARRSDLDGAAAALERARQLAPGAAAPVYELAKLARRRGQTAVALARLDEAHRLDPDHAAPLLTAAELRAEAGDWEGAVARCEAAIRTPNPPDEAFARLVHFARRTWRWDLLAAHEPEVARRTRARLDAGEVPAEDPWTHLARVDDPAENLEIAAAYARRAARRVGVVEAPPRRPYDATRRLHVGYLTDDWRDHATLQLLVGVLEAHDTGRFRVTAYTTNRPDGSALAARATSAVERVVDLSERPDDDAADQIRADGVDLLVDLKGHTGGGRLEILARRPAPVQVTWLGHPGTTGAEFIDFALVDDVVVLPERRSTWSERLAVLPNSYQPNDPDRALPPARTRAELGLPEGPVILASFNDAWKVTAAVFDLWLALLRDLPQTLLWVLARDAAGLKRLRERAAAAGVNPARVVGARRLPWEAHLARVQVADVALDAWPVGGHTTTSELLWAGVPVVTWPGAGMASRVSASLLKAGGAPDLVATDAEHYRRIVTGLVRKAEARNTLRRRLIANRSVAPLWDVARFTRDLESLYNQMVATPAGSEPLTTRPPSRAPTPESDTFEGRIAPIRNALGQGAFGAALTRADALVRDFPDHPVAWQYKGQCHLRLGDTAYTRACWERVTEVGGDAAWAVWAACTLDDIATSAEASRAQVDVLFATLPSRMAAASTPSAHELDSVAFMGFFRWAYQGRDLRPLMEALAAFILRRWPVFDFTAPHCAPGATRRPGPTRVGVLWNWPARHPVDQACAWMVRALFATKHDVTILLPDKSRNPFQESLPPNVRSMVVPAPAGDVAAFLRLRDRVAALDLDLLFFPEVGMDPVAYLLALSRVARHQCVAAGHPVTTGMSTMDSFVSVAALEGDDCQSQYTEDLVLLEGTPYLYTLKAAPPDEPHERRRFSLPAGAHVYAAPHNLIKMHPDFDAVLRAILERDPDALLLVYMSLGASWSSKLKNRWETTLAPYADRVRWQPRYQGEEFVRYLRCVDVVLDPIYFGMGTTMLYALPVGTPIVTLAGTALRSRVVSGLYQNLGVTDTVVHSLDEYVEVALSLARNKDLNRSVRERTIAAARAHSDDQTIVESWIDFVRRATQPAVSSG
jgi:protein O-GlcNAc transferase